MADFTAGLLAVIAVLAGLVSRDAECASGFEVSLLGAALAVQAQRFVSVEGLDRGARRERLMGPPMATTADLARHARAQRAHDELEPYYRAYAAADGFLVIACLYEAQRAAAAAVLGLVDPWAANPQAPPADAAERDQRLALVAEFERRIAAEPVAVWVERFRQKAVPAAEVRLLEQLFEHDQATANGLVHTLSHASAGTVKLLGSLFKIDGVATPPRRAIPALGEHTGEVLSECSQGRT
jgi:crotonobetainyl-CoA:carnitine CoA-transferase CaiB-like acyl-CoA transferase